MLINKRGIKSFNNEQVTDKDLDIISVCVIRNQKCTGCVYGDVIHTQRNGTDKRYKTCRYMCDKFNIEKPAELEKHLY